MAQALFSLQATSMEVHECGDRVDPPSAAIIAAVGRIAQGAARVGIRGETLTLTN